MLYGTLIRFYIPVLKYNDLHEMREDLIEILTSLTVRGELGKLTLQLCRLCTKEEENLFTSKLSELQGIKPERIGIDRLFTLNQSSKLIDMYSSQEAAKNGGLLDGDIGGSAIIIEEPVIQTS